MVNPFYKLMLITSINNQPVDQYLYFIKVCIAAGVTSVQLREKHKTYKELIQIGLQLKSVLRSFNVPLVINDNIEIAAELDVDGVHLGQTDGDVIWARKLLGKKKIIGLSVNTLEELSAANALPIDYVGIGAIYPTKNKGDITTIWGLEGLKRAAQMSKHIIVALGGINGSNAKDVVNAGANGIAAIGLFHDSLSPEQTIKNLINVIQLQEN